jgi:F420-non-reducing hydrogenase iron-sulfur subunit
MSRFLPKSRRLGGIEDIMVSKPRILGFLCHWCCYAAADAAGVARFQYPPHIRVIRVMCTGRIDPVFILEGFLQGADGIFVGG